MSNSRSPQEFRGDLIDMMGSPLGEYFHDLHDDIAGLHLRWAEMQILFSGKQKNINLLNDAAPYFFYYTQQIMWDNVLMHICRLTDKTKVVGRDNLTVRILPPFIKDKSLRTDLEALVTESTKKTEFARDWRNRRLAHRELPPRKGEKAKPLAAAKTQHVDDALEALRKVMNALYLQFSNSTVAYEHSVPAPGGARSLLISLEQGVALRQEKRRKRSVS